MRIGENLGQLRVAGRVPYMYDMASERPYPYKSEDQLIEEGIETDLMPPWGELPATEDKPAVPAYRWPNYISPPSVPSEEAEVYAIRRGAEKTIYPWAGTWNENKISTKALDKASYPPGPPMSGLGQSTFADVGRGALLTVPIFGGLSYATFRAMGKESQMLWKIALGAAGFIFAIRALGAVADAVGGSSTVAK